MKALKWSLLFCLLSIPWSGPCEGRTEPARAYIVAVEDYGNGDYRKAAEGFATLAAAGIVSGELFYNCGNAWFRAGELGRAVLWYERALALIPRDPDLRFNLDVARSKVKDRVAFGPSPLVRTLIFWRYTLSPRAVALTALVLNTLFWIALGVRVLTRRPLTLILLLLLAGTLIFTATAGWNYHDARFGKTGIVLSDKVSVRSGYTETATELFVLHAGSPVTVSDRQHGHIKILFADGKIGWVPETAVERICITGRSI